MQNFDWINAHGTTLLHIDGSTGCLWEAVLPLDRGVHLDG